MGLADSDSLVDIILKEEKNFRQNLRQLTKEQVLDHLASLDKILEQSDRFKKQHSSQMVEYVKRIAQALKYNEDDIQILCEAASLHDIGKEKIDKKILDKPGKLTEEEYDKVKIHSIYGEIMVDPLSSISMLILHHHERYDGFGYPEGLEKNKIPLGSRIIAVVDAYDAMTNDRPYRKALSKEEAIKELEKCEGTQFDPKIVNIFLKILNKNKKYK